MSSGRNADKYDLDIYLCYVVGFTRVSIQLLKEA